MSLPIEQWDFHITPREAFVEESNVKMEFRLQDPCMQFDRVSDALAPLDLTTDVVSRILTALMTMNHCGCERWVGWTRVIRKTNRVISLLSRMVTDRRFLDGTKRGQV